MLFETRQAIEDKKAWEWYNNIVQKSFTLCGKSGIIEKYSPEQPRDPETGQFLSTDGEGGRGLSYDSDKNSENTVNGITGTVTSDGIKTVMSKHTSERISERNLAVQDVKDALTNPLKITDIKIDELDRPSKNYIGEKVTVSVNPKTGKIITAHGTHTKTALELKGNSKNED